jgi:hypothetical protein
MKPLTDLTQGELFLDLLFGALRVQDEQLNSLAVELLGRFGEAPIRRLIREAANPKNRPGHRVCVLRAIRRIGPIHDLAAYLDLSVLAQDKHPAIRAATAQLLWDLGHPQGDLTEEPGSTMLPFADELPPGKRNRAPGRLALTPGSTCP